MKEIALWQYLSQGKGFYPVLGQKNYPVELKKNTLKQNKNNRPVTWKFDLLITVNQVIVQT